MSCRGQSSIEWLITHSWAILTVLSVGILMFHLGVFETSATPRFEGLESAALQPVPHNVQLYSDGVMIFTVINTRPYSVKFEYIEVAPIANREDVVQTNLDALIKSGGMSLFEINASNLVGTSQASILAASPVSGESSVGFHLCIRESYVAGARDIAHTVCGSADNIRAEDTPSFDGCLIGQGDCGACYICVPLGDPDNPDLGWCQFQCPSPCHICVSGDCIWDCDPIDVCVDDGDGSGHCEKPPEPPV